MANTNNNNKKESMIVYLDLESFSAKTPFENEDGKTVEVVFEKGRLDLKSFHVCGAWIKEIGISYTKGKDLVEKSWIIDPEVKEWSKEALDYYNQKGLLDIAGVPFSEAWEDFSSHVNGCSSVIFVAHNGIAFDSVVIDLNLKRLGLTMPKDVEFKIFDTLAWAQREARKWFEKPPKDFKLSTLFNDVVGGKIPDAHTALGDIRAMRRLFTDLVGNEDKWNEIVRKEAIAWNPNTEQSVHGLSAKICGEKKTLSFAGARALEDAGHYTRASLIYIHIYGQDTRRIASLSEDDHEIVDEYVKQQIGILKENKENAPMQKPKKSEIFTPPGSPRRDSQDVRSWRSPPPSPSREFQEVRSWKSSPLSPSNKTIPSKNDVLVPGMISGVGPALITRLKLNLKRDPTVKDLEDWVKGSKSYSDFENKICGVLKNLDTKYVKMIWNHFK